MGPRRLRPRAPAGPGGRPRGPRRSRTPRRSSARSTDRTGGPAPRADHQRRVPGLRDGDRGASTASPSRRSRPARPGRRPVLPRRRAAGGPDVRDGPQGAGEGPGGGGRRRVVLGTWRRWPRRWSGRWRAGRSTRRSWSGSTRTDRHRNARKSRKTYRFSKDWRMHEAMTYFTLYRYNFCWPVRTLRRAGRRTARGGSGPRRWRPGLTDHVWSLRMADLPGRSVSLGHDPAVRSRRNCSQLM